MVQCNNCVLVVNWLGSVMVRMLNLRTKDCAFNSQSFVIEYLLPVWVTAYGQVNHQGIITQPFIPRG